MPAATRLSQLSRLSCVMPSTPSNRLSGDGHAIGRNTDAQERRRERGSGIRWGGAAAARRGTAPSNLVAGRGGRDRLSPSNRINAGARRHIAREIRAAISPPCGSSPWAKTACGLGERASRATVPRQRQAHNRLMA
jgi:hypothetical protein